MRPTITAIVCAYNEARFLPACLHSLLAQTRPPDEIIVVNNASTDETAAVARAVPGVRVVDEPVKGLVVARETARRATRSDVLVYVDADCRAPLLWLERIERRFMRHAAVVAVTGPVPLLRLGLDRPRADPRLRLRRRAADARARAIRSSGSGAILYGGNFAVRRDALDAHRRASTARSSSTARTRTSAGGWTPLGSIALAHGLLGLDVGAPVPRDGEAAGCSGCTSATSGRKSFVIARPTANTST